MTPPITPGAYLMLRRTAAGLSVADVAELLATEPRTPEHLRAEQIELIEADAQPMTLATVAAFRAIYRFDVEVLFRLAELAQGQDLPEPRTCRLCGWGTVYDNLSWPILGLCRPCYEAQPPAVIAAWIDHLATPTPATRHPAFAVDVQRS